MDASTEQLASHSVAGAAASLEPDKVARKKEKLTAQIEDLKTKIAETQSQLDEANAKLGDTDPAARVQRHIRLLHQYNEIKDIGMGMFGLIADRRGVRVRDVFEEFGVGETD